MVGFVARLSILAGGATVTAILTVAIASGIVEIGAGEGWISNVFLGLALLVLSLLVATWYGSVEIAE